MIARVITHPDVNFPMYPMEENPVFDFVARHAMIWANKRIAFLPLMSYDHLEIVCERIANIGYAK